jgi:hypothetical protein
MFTTLLSIKILGLVVTTEQLISAGFTVYLLTTELLARNPKVKANTLFQLVLGLVKRYRTEDDKIDDIKRILRGGGR